LYSKEKKMTVLDPKQIPVPAQNSADNDYIQKVIGNKTDNRNGDSLYALAHVMEEHDHAAANVYPSLASAVEVTSASAVWTLGAFAEIVPASAITSAFDIHFINVDSVSAVDSYELWLYSGAVSSEVLIGKARFSKTANISPVSNSPFQTIIQPANTRISAKLAVESANARIAAVSISYHFY